MTSLSAKHSGSDVHIEYKSQAICPKRAQMHGNPPTELPKEAFQIYADSLTAHLLVHLSVVFV